MTGLIVFIALTILVLISIISIKSGAKEIKEEIPNTSPGQKKEGERQGDGKPTAKLASAEETRRDKFFSLACLVTAIILINWMLAQSGFEWWHRLYQRTVFFGLIQTVLVLGFWAISWKTKNTIPKKLGILLVIIALVVAVKVAREPTDRSAELTIDPPASQGSFRSTETILARAGEWTEIPVARLPQGSSKAEMLLASTGRGIQTETTPGVPCTYRVNDDNTEWRTGPNGEKIDLFSKYPGVIIWRYLINPDRDAFVTITRW